MPIVEVASEVLGGVFRFIGNVLVEVVLEFLVKGMGYIICKPFNRSVNPNGLLVFIVGVFAWMGLAFTLYAGFEYVYTQARIDSCLDSGGSFVYDTNECTQQ